MERDRTKVERNPKDAKKKLNKEEKEKRENLRDKALKLQEEEIDLDEKIHSLIAAGVTLDMTAEMNALHEYNDMKDVTQMVLGLLSNAEGVTFAQLHERYSLPLD